MAVIEDHERIDWLERVAEHIMIEVRIDPPFRRCIFQIRIGKEGRTQLAEAPTLREAIDNAMKVPL